MFPNYLDYFEHKNLKINGSLLETFASLKINSKQNVKKELRKYICLIVLYKQGPLFRF